MFNYSYSFPYIYFLTYLLFLFLCELYYRKKRKPVLGIKIFVWMGFLFFFGLRGFVNTDCINYYVFFENLKTLWDDIPYKTIIDGYDWESGFITVVYVFKSIISNYFVWTFTWVIIAIISLNSFFNSYVKYYSLGFLLFYVFGGYGILTNFMRNSLSLFLFLFSLQYIEKKSFTRYTFVNLIGVLFHTSSLLYIPAYYIIKKRMSVRILFALLFFLNLLFFVQIDVSRIFLLLGQYIISDRLLLIMNAYIDGKQTMTVLSIGYVERTFTYIMVCLFYDKMISLRRSNQVFLNCFVVYYFIYYFLWGIETAALRMATLFVCSYWVFYSEVFCLLKKNAIKLLFIYLFYFYSSFKFISGNSYSYHEYKNILYQNESFESARKRIQM